VQRSEVLIDAVTVQVESWYRTCPAIPFIGSNMQVLQSLPRGLQLPTRLSPTKCVRI